jgi:GT2 family glycosyltransferase
MVSLRRNQFNLGFAAAVSEAVAGTNSKYVALLNDDTEVDPAWLARLLEVIETDPAIGSCAAQVRFLSHPDRINSAGVTVDRAGFAHERLGGYPVSASEDRPVEVFGPSGSAALYRRDALDQVGVFESRFFAYLEDVDLAWRLRRAGWRCLYVPAAVVYHVHSGTSGQGSPFKAHLLARNQVWVWARNAQGSVILRYLPWIAARYIGLSVFYIVRRRTLAPVRGLIAGIRGLGGIRDVRTTLPFLSRAAFVPIKGPISELRSRGQRDRFAGDHEVPRRSDDAG